MHTYSTMPSTRFLRTNMPRTTSRTTIIHNIRTISISISISTNPINYHASMHPRTRITDIIRTGHTVLLGRSTVGFLVRYPKDHSRGLHRHARIPRQKQSHSTRRIARAAVQRQRATVRPVLVSAPSAVPQLSVSSASGPAVCDLNLKFPRLSSSFLPS
jgi:hypothetical protein